MISERLTKAQYYAKKYHCSVQEILDRWYVARLKADRALSSGEWVPELKRHDHTGRSARLRDAEMMLNSAFVAEGSP